MNFTDSQLSVLLDFKINSSDPHLASGANSLFWQTVIGSIEKAIINQTDFKALLAEESDFINFGACKNVLDNIEEIRIKILGETKEYNEIKICFLSDFIIQTFLQINEGSRIEYLKKEIQYNQLQLIRLNSEIESIQQAQIQQLQNAMLSKTEQKASIEKNTNLLLQTNQMLRRSIETKKLISNGAFLSVEQKREHVQREQTINANRTKIEASIGNCYQTLKKLSEQIEKLFEKAVEIDSTIAAKKNEIVEIENRQNTASPIQLASKMTETLEYIRDLTKLSARRLKIQPSSVLLSLNHCLTLPLLTKCLDIILEFDPKVFINSRASIFGKPSVLIVPGIGNSIYDWKYNQFVVPLCTPDGDVMASVASGIIEYRLDVDEDKTLITSYAKIPECSTIRSIFQLKQNLIKDYIRWMTAEYKGYRVLPKNIKQWFDHEIAPSKNDIYIPAKFQSYFVSQSEFSKQIAALKTKAESAFELLTEEEFFILGIYLYQQGHYDKSMICFKKLVQKNPNNLFGWYNFGYTAMKAMYKDDALFAFDEYCKRNPQSWWAATVRTHMQRLRTSK